MTEIEEAGWIAAFEAEEEEPSWVERLKDFVLIAMAGVVLSTVVNWILEVALGK